MPITIPKDFDYMKPDYLDIYAQRLALRDRLNSDPKFVEACKEHYRYNMLDFIDDWGMGQDPRNSEMIDDELDIPTDHPLLMFPKQREFLEWVEKRRLSRERGVCEKSRECGVTWLIVWYCICKWLFSPGFSIGYGSRKALYVDKRNSMKGAFQRILFGLKYVPKVLLPEKLVWKAPKDGPETYANMRLLNPDTGSLIEGEAGDHIGRGDRCSIYFIDEYAFLRNQEGADSGMSANTRCIINVSTFASAGDEFFKKVQQYTGTPQHFVFDWRDDPRKDDAWYENEKKNNPPHVVAREYDRNPYAAQEATFMNYEWINSCVDAHKKLRWEPEGLKILAFDPADVGGDNKAIVLRHGNVIVDCIEIKEGDITYAVHEAFEWYDRFRADVFTYDVIGIGAGAIKEAVKLIRPDMQSHVVEYDSRGKVRRPNKEFGVDGLDMEYSSAATRSANRRNKDMLFNRRAQSWTLFRARTLRTHENVTCIEKGAPPVHPLRTLLSISGECQSLNTLKAELCTPLIDYPNGKIKCESKIEMRKRGLSSPNCADAATFTEDVKLPTLRPTYIHQSQQSMYIDAGAGY